MEKSESKTITASAIPRIEIEKGPVEANNVAESGGKMKVIMFITRLFAPNTLPLFLGATISQIIEVDAIATAPAPKPTRKLAILTII
jgi:hypothetical protein